ncbi:MAG: hypothetical protein ACRCX2_28610 [Paraclostridium sp.]
MKRFICPACGVNTVMNGFRVEQAISNNYKLDSSTGLVQELCSEKESIIVRVFCNNCNNDMDNAADYMNLD